MILDGRAIALEIEEEIKREIETLKTRKPCLAVILIGEHPPSEIYVRLKTKACENTGILSIKRRLPGTATEDELIREIDALNIDPNVDGILVQTPLPGHIDTMRVIDNIDPKKDVDGFHSINMGKLLIGQTDGFVPCTPLGIQVMLERSNIKTEGKHVVIVGRSNIVGKPMAALLLQNTPQANSTVTVAHRHTKDLKSFCKSADILIAAIGKPKFITHDMVKNKACVIDVGINRVEDKSAQKGYKIVGDVDFENVKERCSRITPVPGGVGPMTIAMLLKNTLTAYKKAH